MSKRAFLRAAVTSLFAVLLISFVWILFSGINFSDQSVNAEGGKFKHKLFEGLIEGQVVLRRYQGQVVWVLSLSPLQKSQAKELDAYVVNNNDVSYESIRSCDARTAFCVLLASTERSGINIQYTLKEPAKLITGNPWYGGFVNPTNGALYDFLGRRYKGQQGKQDMTSIDVK